jgi:hypothetical protein
VTGVTAPSFDVAISGTVASGNLVFHVYMTDAIGDDVTISLLCDDDPVDVPHMGLLESAILAQDVEVTVPMENAGGGGGSGTSTIGEDPEFTYNYSIVIYEN